AVPGRGPVGGSGDDRSVRTSFRRRLNHPAVVKRQLLLGRCFARKYDQGQKRRDYRPADQAHETASAMPNGHRLVFQDQRRKARTPRPSTARPKKITLICVVAKTKIQPSNAISAGSG